MPSHISPALMTTRPAAIRAIRGNRQQNGSEQLTDQQAGNWQNHQHADLLGRPGIVDS